MVVRGQDKICLCIRKVTAHTVIKLYQKLLAGAACPYLRERIRNVAVVGLVPVTLCVCADCGIYLCVFEAVRSIDVVRELLERTA